MLLLLSNSMLCANNLVEEGDTSVLVGFTLLLKSTPCHVGTALVALSL